MQVVLDDAHRAALVADLLDEVEHRVDPLRVDARRRLVEQQHVGLGGQHAGQRDRASSGRRTGRRPGRRRTRPCRRSPSQSIAFVPRLGLGPLDRAVRRTPSVAKFSPGWSCTAIITFCRHDSRLNSRTSWNERTMPLRATRCGVEPDELLAVELDRAGVGRDGAGEQVEHRRLAGAVGADEGGDRALAQLDGEVVGGDDAAEALADTFAVCEHDRRLVPAPARAGSPRRSAARRRSCSATCATVWRHPVVDHLDARLARARSPREPAPQREALWQGALRPHPHQHGEQHAVDDELHECRPWRARCLIDPLEDAARAARRRRRRGSCR